MSSKAKVAALKAKAALRGTDPLLSAAAATGDEEQSKAYQQSLLDKAAKAAKEESEFIAAETALQEYERLVTTFASSLLNATGLAHDSTSTGESSGTIVLMIPATVWAQVGAFLGHDGQHLQQFLPYDRRQSLLPRYAIAYYEQKYCEALQSFLCCRYADCSRQCRDVLLSYRAHSNAREQAAGGRKGENTPPVVLRTWLLRCRAFGSFHTCNLPGLPALHINKALSMLGTSSEVAMDRALHGPSTLEGRREKEVWLGVQSLQIDLELMNLFSQSLAPPLDRLKSHLYALKASIVHAHAVQQELQAGGQHVPSHTHEDVHELMAQAAILLEEGFSLSAYTTTVAALGLLLQAAGTHLPTAALTTLLTTEPSSLTPAQCERLPPLALLLAQACWQGGASVVQTPPLHTPLEVPLFSPGRYQAVTACVTAALALHIAPGTALHTRCMAHGALAIALLALAREGCNIAYLLSTIGPGSAPPPWLSGGYLFPCSSHLGLAAMAEQHAKEAAVLVPSNDQPGIVAEALLLFHAEHLEALRRRFPALSSQGPS